LQLLYLDSNRFTGTRTSHICYELVVSHSNVARLTPVLLQFR